MRNHHLKIVFFAPYPWGEAPSQRFRFEQYLSVLQELGFKVTFFSFYNQSTWKRLYSNPPLFQFFHLIKGIISSLLRIPFALQADYIFVHREVIPLGPPLIEWLLAKVFRKRIIYDFDDAIWLTDNSHESYLERIIRNRGKVSSICRWSFKVSCGNQYLMDFARKYNNNTIFLPTTINTASQHNPEMYPQKKESNKLTIGWTGTHSTLKYLEDIQSVLSTLEEKHDIEILVIANKEPAFELKSLCFLKWNKQTEIEDLLKIDIGIMPLPDDNWTKGKGGFKALQFMALEIPCVISPVGINSTIVTDGVNGYLAHSPTDWIEKLTKLIQNKTLREGIGKRGRKTIIDHYSTEANASVFLSLFKKL